jgi:hypothetical protein
MPQTLVLRTAIQYLDTAQASKFYSRDGFLEILVGPINSLYSFSITSTPSVQSPGMDMWANVRIPSCDRLDANIAANSTGWKQLAGNGPLYSSLLGIPVSGLSQLGNTPFTITITYLDLDCSNISRGPPIPFGIKQNGVSWCWINDEHNDHFSSP